MADRGFIVDEYLARKKVEFSSPPFMTGKCQLSPQDEQKQGKLQV